MKKDYDFSKGDRGNSYRPDATLNFPVYSMKTCASSSRTSLRRSIATSQPSSTIFSSRTCGCRTRWSEERTSGSSRFRKPGGLRNGYRRVPLLLSSAFARGRFRPGHW